MIIVELFIWNLFGIFIVAMCHMVDFGGVFSKTEGFEYVNPIYIYKYNHVNWFGAIVVAIIAWIKALSASRIRKERLKKHILCLYFIDFEILQDYNMFY